MKLPTLISLPLTWLDSEDMIRNFLRVLCSPSIFVLPIFCLILFVLFCLQRFFLSHSHADSCSDGMTTAQGRTSKDKKRTNRRRHKGGRSKTLSGDIDLLHHCKVSIIKRSRRPTLSSCLRRRAITAQAGSEP